MFPSVKSAIGLSHFISPLIVAQGAIPWGCRLTTESHFLRMVNTTITKCDSIYFRKTYKEYM